MWMSPDLFVCLFAIVLLIAVGILGSRSEFRHRVKRLSEKYFREYYNGVDFNYPALRTCFKKQEIVPKCCGFGNPLRTALGGSR